MDNKLSRSIKLILIIFVIGLISILTPNKVSADTIVSNGSSSLFAATEVGTETKESVTNSNDTGSSFAIKFSYFSGDACNSWWMMCNAHGEPFKEVLTLYTVNSTNVATSEEAYILSTLDTNNYKGKYENNPSQIAWWYRSGSTGYSGTDVMYLSRSETANTLTNEQLIAIDELFSTGVINSSDSDAVERLLQVILTYTSLTSTEFTSYTNTITDDLVELYSWYAYNIQSGNQVEDSTLLNRIDTIFNNLLTSEGRQYVLTLIKSGYFNSSSDSETLVDAVQDVFTDYISVNTVCETLYTELIDIFVNYYTSSSDADTSLSAEAKAFQNYVDKYKDGSNTEEYTIDGQSYTAPKLDMEVSLDDDDVSVEFKATTQQWEVGPFTVTYPYETYENIMFSGLYGASLKVIKNGTEVELTYGVDWTFEYYYDRSNAPYEYPESGQEFYILINYDPQVTYISEFKLDYKYLNAGGLWIDYNGYYGHCSYCGGNFDYTDVGLAHCHTISKTYYIEETDAQNMAVVVRAAQWYTNAELTWEGWRDDVYSKITIEKTVVDDSGNKVSVDDTFTFDIYIDYTGTGNNYEKYTTLTVTTTDGYGKASISKIKWANDDDGNAIQPKYRIVERTKSGYSNNNQTREGWLDNGTNSFSYENIKEPKVGYLEVDKTFIDSSPVLKHEEFTVYVTVSGTYTYSTSSGESGSVDDDSKTFTIILNSRNDFTWEAEFEWWDDDAPKYSGVKEYIPDDAAYELYSISSKSGTLKADSTKTIEVQNTDTYSRLYLDKSILGDSEPKSGEEFTVIVSLKGNFKYVDKYGNIPDEYDEDDNTITITLNEGNSWSWKSQYIIWTSSKAPQYSVYEEDTGSYEFYSISTTTGSTTNNSKDEYFKFDEKINTATITNEDDDWQPSYRTGYIEVYKILETSADDTTDYSNYDFEFTVEITSDSAFQYGETSYSAGETVTITETINPGSANKWTSSKIKWKKGASVPTYVVTETNIPSDTTFVSIANDDKTVTDETHSISGKLSSGETVFVRITNATNIIDNEGTINIVKEVTGDTSYLDALYQIDDSFEIPVKFTLSVTGTFKYVEDGESKDNVTTEKYTSDEPLVLGSEDSPITITLKYKDGKLTTSGTWSSGTFIWADGVDAPQYTIKELTESNDYFTFVDWTRGDDTQPVETSTITGTINSGTNTFVAHNETRYELRHGYIEVTKVVDEALTTDMTFTISVSYWGTFREYGTNNEFVEYTEDTDDNPYSENISVTIPARDTTTDEEDTTTTATANGIELEWVVDKTSDSEQGPQWKATETDIPTGMEFVSMYTESGTNQSNSLEGRLIDNGDDSSSVIKLVCKNTIIGPKQGKLQISKTYVDSNGNEITGVDFEFTITIHFYDALGNEDESRKITYNNVTITSGSVWRTTNWIQWNSTDAKAPTFEITETDGSIYNVTMTNDGKGSLEENDIVTVAVKNTKSGGEISGKISVTKQLGTVGDKISASDLEDDTFTFEVTVTGTFTYEGTRYEGTTMTISSIYLTIGETWTSKDITWDENDTAPEFVVTETYIPSGWEFSSWGSGGNSGSLRADETVPVTCINDYPGIGPTFELIMALGGKVWDDTDDSDGKLSDVGENGVIDDDEPGIEGVKVTIYRVIYSGTEVIDVSPKIYVDGVEYTYYSTYTDANGNWYVENISVPGILDGESGDYAAYEVEFTYDGYTYEPTTYLAITSGEDDDYEAHFSNGGAGDNIDADEVLNYVGSASKDDLWLLNSQAIDDDRAGFNEKFTTIYGGSAMDDNGDTTGYATSEDSVPSNNEGATTLEYSSHDLISALDSDNVRKVSTLDTTDSNGDTYEKYLTTASTYTTERQLVYPFDYSSGFHLESWDKEVEDQVARTTYTYSAIYNYVLSINLGLVQRESPDIAVEKDLVEATVVINGKVLTYKFNSYIDFDDDNYTDLLYKQLAIADREIEYSLGVYSSDYYYRASVYGDTSDSSSTASTLAAFYVGQIGYTDLSSLELEIYLKYNITVTNESETYTVEVKGLNDYYDNTLELVTNTTDSRTYVETYNGESVNEIMYLADSPSVTYYNSNGTEVSSSSFTWSTSNITKSDSELVANSDLTFNAVSTSLNKLATGEKAVIETTFKVTKSDTSEVKDAIELGEKHNVVEIASYSSYYSSTSKLRWSNEGDVTGRVDEDSAPDNIDLTNYNDKTKFEDDTDAAPILTVGLVSEDREISGLVWEDAETETIEYNQTVGNGKYATADGDTVISGLTTELVQAISIPEIDEDLTNGDTIYYKTTSGGTTTDSTSSDIVYKEYDFIWPTEDTNIDGLEGNSLESITGFDSTTTTNSQGVYTFTSVPAGNYKVRFVYGDTKITTGNDDYEVVYNGQDYKSTSYQTGYEDETVVVTTDEDGNEVTVTYPGSDSDGDGYSDNAWHDLTNTELNDEQVSDARDNEARRLYVTSKSEILTYENTLLLSTADEDVDISTGSGNEDYYDELFGDYEASKSSADGPVYGSGYYMYAETAKIALDVENLNTTFSYDPIYDEEGNAITVTGIEGTERDGILTVTGTINKNGLSTGNDFTYEVNNIDFGIEERSQTKITLDKQIKEITLTNNGNVILDAIFDITYELGDDDTIKSSVVLNEELSTGYDNLASLNRTSTSQGYRYIMIDSTILQGTTITVQYQLTAFNVGEADTCNVVMSDLWNTINTADYNGTALEDAITALTSPYYTSSSRLNRDASSTYQYGTYVGSKYYLGVNGNTSSEDSEQMLVETTVRQIIDYVDPDVEFVATDNLADDQAWSTTAVDYLVENNLIDKSSIKVVKNDGTIVTTTDADGNIRVCTYEDAQNGVVDMSSGDYYYTFLNDELQQLITSSQNNVILSMDRTINADGSVTNKNTGLVKETVPYSAEYDYDDATATINLQVSKYYSSEDEINDIDNIAEIIKVENTVGRRDIRNIAGNTSTYELVEDAVGYDETKTVYEISLEEPDTSATEVITLTPPTGLDSSVQLILQIVGITLVACVILAIGIIIIKKKVLIKK